eukprot:c10339_g1_i1.p1 GENE.c10339_g1_i1~~c10339_g1_i1.p1  ORF type:complete len:268 (+),score=88.23 c10339_g1_i1:1590-2393(+)
MTVFVMLVEPVIARFLELNSVVAGAWMGGSVNNTGNVVAAAALLGDEEAENIAAIVKMLQNSMIGFITVGVTIFWIVVVEPQENAAANEATLALSSKEDDLPGDVSKKQLLANSNSSAAKATSVVTPKSTTASAPEDASRDGIVRINVRSKLKPVGLPWPSLMQLYDRFPKFVLGYFIASCIITVYASSKDTQSVKHALSMVGRVSRWYALLGFVCLGQETNFKVLGARLQGGRVLGLYWAAQLFNVVVTLLVAWLCFAKLGSTSTK